MKPADGYQATASQPGSLRQQAGVELGSARSGALGDGSRMLLQPGVLVGIEVAEDGIDDPADRPTTMQDYATARSLLQKKSAKPTAR